MALKALYEVTSYAGPLSNTLIKGFPGFAAIRLIEADVLLRLLETLRKIGSSVE